MRIYLDACCLSRPFDEKTQPKVRLESEAVLIILKDVQDGRHEMVTSEILEVENEKNPDAEERAEVGSFLRLARRRVAIASKEISRAEQVVALGFGAYDALHVACAEAGGADYLLSTDDRMVRLGEKYRSELGVGVMNPVKFCGIRK